MCCCHRKIRDVNCNQDSIPFDKDLIRDILVRTKDYRNQAIHSYALCEFTSLFNTSLFWMFYSFIGPQCQLNKIIVAYLIFRALYFTKLGQLLSSVCTPDFFVVRKKPTLNK